MAKNCQKKFFWEKASKTQKSDSLICKQGKKSKIIAKNGLKNFFHFFLKNDNSQN